MIIPSGYSSAGAADRLAGRLIRIGLSVKSGSIVEHLLGPAADVVFGAGGLNVFAVEGWAGPDLRVLSGGRWLTLGPGMSVTMCHETGEDRMEGDFEELSGAGVAFPFFVNVSRLNIRVRPGLAMLVEYMLPG
jgi:hypothetical protein